MAEMTAQCGPHCGLMSTPTSAEKGHSPIIRHCDRCHGEYDRPMRQRPNHGPGGVYG